MTAFIVANMAPLMFGALVVFLLFGYPIAFALAAHGLIFGTLGIELGLLKPELLQALPERIFGLMRNDTLLAIPFFTFMGLVLERSGMAEDLLDTIGQLFGPIGGGLAYAVIFVGALLAATTGVVAASVISMGLISLPIMLRYGYDRSMASGVIAASGTLAQIIPPSLVLIILADQLGRSVGDMYEGAIIPGILLAGLYAGWVFLVSIFRPKAVPALPKEARSLRGFALLRRVIVSLFSSPFSDLSRSRHDLSRDRDAHGRRRHGRHRCDHPGLDQSPIELEFLKQAMDKTAKLSAFVMFILVGATVFGLVFRAVNGDLWVESLLLDLPGGQIGFLIVVNLMVFLLAFFLDFFELAFIIVPLLAPVADKLGIDLIWFGVLLGVNMQTSFMHPPFGFALFYLRSVAPSSEYVDRVTGRKTAGVTTAQIYWGAIPFVCIQLVMVALVIVFPGLVQHLAHGPARDVAAPPVQIEMPQFEDEPQPAPTFR